MKTKIRIEFTVLVDHKNKDALYEAESYLLQNPRHVQVCSSAGFNISTPKTIDREPNKQVVRILSK